jgi:hypothetical protein
MQPHIRCKPEGILSRFDSAFQSPVVVEQPCIVEPGLSEVSALALIEERKGHALPRSNGQWFSLTVIPMACEGQRGAMASAPNQLGIATSTTTPIETQLVATACDSNR